MNKAELLKVLEERGVDHNAYSIEGGRPDDVYVLSPEPHGRWSVCYSERGERLRLRLFDSEEEACAELLRRLERDPLTKRPA